MTCLVGASQFISSTLQKLFYRIGLGIGKYPCICIFLSFILTGLISVGLTDIKEENRADKLWVPAESDNQEYYRYVQKYYKDPFIEEHIITSDDILTPESLISMLNVDEDVKGINVGKTWNELCYRVREHCYVSSILELWGFNRTVVNSLTREDILKKVNTLHIYSPLTFRFINVSTLLGGIQRNDEGEIIGAVAGVVTYSLKRNDVLGEDGNYIDNDVEKWETEFINIDRCQYENITIALYASSSLNRESEKAIDNDLFLLVIGYMLLFVYIMLMLGKFSLLEHKIYVSLAGLLTVAMTCVVSIGLCSLFGLVYSLMNNILPFLLLGVGVDDMFVIVQSWENLTAEEKTKPVHERSALALQHAGVSITVTSVTDMIVFAVGATTILPGLRSFCIYCGVGICSLFILSILFFTSVLVLDACRVHSKRDACVYCYRHADNYESSTFAKRQLLQEFFQGVYTPWLMKLPVKVFLILLTIVMLIFGILGTLKLEQHFDFALFVSTDSYINTFLDTSNKFFPDRGIPSAIYLPNVQLFYEQDAMTKFYKSVRNNEYVDPASCSNWYDDYNKWLQDNKADNNNYDVISRWPKSEEVFFQWIHEFLNNSTLGRQHLNDVIFNETTSEYISSRINFNHIVLGSASDEVNAVDSIYQDIDSAGFESEDAAFAFSKPYLYFETNTIIKVELWRNLGLASLCVLIVVMLLLANAKASILVFFCVILTLVNVSGFMYYWNMNIDILVTMLFILSIGVAVDYAAHIGHTFMTVTGSRNERTSKTMKNIGPAVFNGGFSTFLVFILLSISKLYVFQVFFKVFLLVVIFGLFHGMVLLPVLLSLVGPSPLLGYQHDEQSTNILAKNKRVNRKDEDKGVDNTAFTVDICPPEAYPQHVSIEASGDISDATGDDSCGAYSSEKIPGDGSTAVVDKQDDKAAIVTVVDIISVCLLEKNVQVVEDCPRDKNIQSFLDRKAGEESSEEACGEDVGVDDAAIIDDAFSPEILNGQTHNGKHSQKLVSQTFGDDNSCKVLPDNICRYIEDKASFPNAESVDSSQEIEASMK